MRTVRIVLVRHGQTQENKEGIVQGQLDTELDAMGESQAKETAKALRSISFDEVHSSDLKRAVKTAEAIVELQAAALEVQKDAELRERFLGELQGKIRVSMKHVLDAQDGSASLESRGKFGERIIQWWDKMIGYATKLPQDEELGAEPVKILVVTHGGYLNALFRMFAARQSRYKLTLAEGVTLGGHQNCAITEMEVRKQDKWMDIQVLRCGDTRHIEKEHLDAELDTNADQVP